jgi:hypothetical protein
MKTPPPHPASAQPTSHQATQRQLDRLFGESLFGAWPESQGAMASGLGRRPGRRRRRLGVVLLAALTASGAWYYRRGGGEQAAQGRGQAAGEVAALLAEGALDKLSASLNRLLPRNKPVTAEDPHLDLIVSAEAALYRYHDAAPERLARIEPFLSHDSGQPARLLARLTVASRPERMAAQATLLNLPPAQAQGSEYHALMAGIHEDRGDMQAAHASWEHSFKAGPQWLPHRYLQCAFEARQRNHAAVAQITEHMVRVTPDSPWTRLAQQHFADAPSGATPVPIPVAQYFAELAPIFRGLAGHDLAAIRQAIGRAFDAVNGQAAFVLDAFKSLRDAKADSLAMELTSYETWPRGNTWAKNALANLQIALAGHKPSPANPAGVAVDSRPDKVSTTGPHKKAKNKSVVKKAGKGKPKRSPRRK